MPTEAHGPFFLSAELIDLVDFSKPSMIDSTDLTRAPLDVNYVTGDVMETAVMLQKETRDYIRNAVFICRNGFIKDGEEKRFLNNEDLDLNGPIEFSVNGLVEKMSKSKFNVVNPDDIITKYGADTLRLYEMFLGPLEQSKPWDTNGIEGTSRFLKKFWNLFYESDVFSVSDEAPTKPEFKVLHATLKKVTEDIERMSFNTSVSQFMIAVNELAALKCHKRDVLEPLTIALAPFAPHIAEELWSRLGHVDSVTGAKWPHFDAQYLVEENFSYPISFNGKTRLQLEFPIALDAKSVEAAVLANPEVQQRLEGKLPKKVIVVPKRIVNIVV